MKKLAALSFALLTTLANAETVTGEGEYRFGPETAENVACNIAEERAIQNAIENFVGEFIEHQVNEVCKDEKCTMFRSFYSEVGGEVKKIIDKNRIVVPDRKHSVCIVTVKADVEKINNPIQLTIQSDTEFRDGESFNVKAASNRKGAIVLFNLVDDKYKFLSHTTLHKDRESVLPKEGKLQALLPVGKSQSKELLVFLFTTQELTLRKQYSKIEFEQMVKELPFTTRKIVNHQINIMR